MPADGFYEWRRAGGVRMPVYFHLPDDGPLALAGLWGWWPGANRVRTCSIVTTAAVGSVAAVHDRMPVVLRPEWYEAWLEPGSVDDRWWHPDAMPELAATPVSRAVNDVRANGPQLVEPLPDVGVQEALDL